jgi:serine protease AprX
VAPGTYVLSARANTTLDGPWANYPNDGRYVFFGGTSMAAPVVAGAAALVREWFATAHPGACQPW